MAAMMTAVLATMVTTVVTAMMAMMAVLAMVGVTMLAVVGMAMAGAAILLYITTADFAARDVFIVYHIIPPISICNL